MITQICEIQSDIYGPQNVKILAQFRTASQLDRESENGIANYGHSR